MNLTQQDILNNLSKYFASQGKTVAPTIEAIKAANDSSLPSLPSIGNTGNTPTLSPVPTTEPTLPATSDTGSLVGFKDNMARVMSLAEAKRNDLLKQFMMPFKGTMQASDFTSLFNDFTTQSDQSNKTILEKLIPKPDMQIITETDASGRTTAITIDKNTGKTINKTDLGVIGKPTTNNTKITGEELKQFINKQIATPDFQKLSDTDKILYIQSQGGTPYDFGF